MIFEPEEHAKCSQLQPSSLLLAMPLQSSHHHLYCWQCCYIYYRNNSNNVILLAEHIILPTCQIPVLEAGSEKGR